MSGVQRKVMGFGWLVALVYLVGFGSQAWAELAVGDPLAQAQLSLKVSESLKDYTAVLVKQERFGKKLGKEEHILFKYANPGKVYMRWIGRVNKGQEALYVAGENKGRMKAHKGGFLGMVTVNIDPKGGMAMEGQHHPILDAGIGPTTKLVLRDLKKGLKNEEVTLFDRGYISLDGRKVMKVEAFFPEKIKGITHTVKKGETLWDIVAAYDQDMFISLSINDDVDDPKDVKEGQEITIPVYYSRRSISYFDVETGLLVKIENYDWSDDLYEVYHYRDLKINVGLDEKDFNPDNDDYRF